MPDRTAPSKGAIWDDYNEQHKKSTISRQLELL